MQKQALPRRIDLATRCNLLDILAHREEGLGLRIPRQWTISPLPCAMVVTDAYRHCMGRDGCVPIYPDTFA